MKKLVNAVKEIIKNSKGFTLLELLVVVLIIGILAGIALPQYQKSVIKAKLSAALINIKDMEDSVDRYLLTNDYPNKYTGIKEFLDIDLSGGAWVSDDWYTIDEANFFGYCHKLGCSITFYDYSLSSSVLEIYHEANTIQKTKVCFTQEQKKGRFVCKYLETLGWEYIDEGY